MRQSFRRALPLLMVCAFLATAYAPLAVADHAYSHRYIVFGRVLDEQGRPIVNTPVEVGLDAAVEVEGLCDPRNNADSSTDAWERTITQTNTNEYGEFIYCFHTHSMPRVTQGEARIKVLDHEQTTRIDTQFRRNFVTVTVPGAEGASNATEFFESYLVSGRLWYSQTRKVVEGVQVYGDTYQQETVTVTFTPAGGGEPVSQQTQTNDYGDFAVRLPVGRDVTGGTVTISARGEEESYSADMTARATDADVKLPAPGGIGGLILRYGALVVLVGLVGAGAWYLFRNVSEKRELEAARARSTRKRAQR